MADGAKCIHYGVGQAKRMNGNALLFRQSRDAFNGFAARTALREGIAMPSRTMWWSIAHQDDEAARMLPPCQFAARGRDAIQHSLGLVASSFNLQAPDVLLRL